MGIVRLWPAILAVFIPGIVLLYLLKQKVKNQKISALNLWKEAYENIQVSSPWEKFRNNILMYMQIAALILLIIALMSPYIIGSSSEYSNILLIIDNSASMSGIYSGGITKLEAAREQAAGYVRSGDGARYTVMSSGGTQSLMVSGSDDTGRVEDAIYDIEETDISGSLESGVSMAQSIVSAWEDYRVIAFTDGSANMQGMDCEVIDLSAKGENYAVQGLSHAVSDDGTVKVMARVSNYGQNQLDTDVNLYIGDQLYDIQRVTVAAGDNSVVYFKDITKSRYKSALTGGQPYLAAETSSKDMLENDNISYDILNGSNYGKILLVTDKNTFLEKALKLPGNKSIDKIPPEDLSVAETEEYSLVVYDGIIPDKLPDTSGVIFINPGRLEGLEGWQQEVFQLPESTVDNKSKASLVKTTECDVTEYIKGYSFTCLEVTGFETPAWATSFFNIDGSRLSAGYAGNYNGKMVAVAGFDLHNTDFPLQTEFPIFMYNLLKKTLSSGIIEKTLYSPGEAVSIGKKDEAGEAVVEGPGGIKETLEFNSSNAVFPGTLKAGLYNVKEGSDIMYFTVPFPEDESDVSKEAVITSGTDTKIKVTKEAGRNISKKMAVMPVLALLLILLMAEWQVYRKHL